MIGGTAATPGAVLLAGTAALRVGAGRLQLATDATVAAPLAVALPEALVVAYDGDELEHLLQSAASVVVGPGLRDDGMAAALLAAVLRHVAADVPVVVDALALGAWSASPPPERRDVVLTPNRQELEQLAGDATADADRAVAIRFGVCVVSFGRVALPDGRVLFDASTARGLGTSGSGDVLAGAIGGLAARCGDGPRAAAWGGFIHRMAGERLARRVAPTGYLARELADELAPTLAGITGP